MPDFKSYVEEALERLVGILIESAVEDSEEMKGIINKRGKADVEGLVYRHIYEHSEVKLKELVEYKKRRRGSF